MCSCSGTWRTAARAQFATARLNKAPQKPPTWGSQQHVGGVAPPPQRCDGKPVRVAQRHVQQEEAARVRQHAQRVRPGQRALHGPQQGLAADVIHQQKHRRTAHLSHQLLAGVAQRRRCGERCGPLARALPCLLLAHEAALRRRYPQEVCELVGQLLRLHGQPAHPHLEDRDALWGGAARVPATAAAARPERASGPAPTGARRRPQLVLEGPHITACCRGAPGCRAEPRAARAAAGRSRGEEQKENSPAGVDFESLERKGRKIGFGPHWSRIQCGAQCLTNPVIRRRNAAQPSQQCSWPRPFSPAPAPCRLPRAALPR